VYYCNGIQRGKKDECERHHRSTTYNPIAGRRHGAFSVRFEQSFFTSAPYKHVKTAIYSIMGVEKASNSNDRSSRTDSFSLRSDAAREREIKLRWEEKDQNLSIN
jgi:hypothetical protein